MSDVRASAWAEVDNWWKPTADAPLEVNASKMEKRAAFVSGAEWQSKQPMVITDDMVERGSKQAHLPRHGNLGQVVGCGCMDRDFYVGEFWSEHIARAVLEAALGVE